MVHSQAPQKQATLAFRQETMLLHTIQPLILGAHQALALRAAQDSPVPLLKNPILL